MAFDDPDLLTVLGALSDSERDAIPFGVIGMTHDGVVTTYNKMESQMAGISRERVVGLNFFSDVAPCTNNYLVAGRFDEPELDVRLDYVFTFRMKPSPVTLRLLKSATTAEQFVLVHRA